MQRTDVNKAVSYLSFSPDGLSRLRKTNSMEMHREGQELKEQQRS